MNGPAPLAADKADATDLPGLHRAAAGPVLPHERIRLLDVLRGFALLGILVVNWGSGHGATGDWIIFLAEGSFYPMFAFLFGLGFALQLIRAEESGRPFVVRYAWRSALLLGIGLVHASLIWTGDILRAYATLAMLLLVARRWHPRVLVAVALAFLVFSMSDTTDLLRPGRFLMRADPEQWAFDVARTREKMAAREARITPGVERMRWLGRTYRHQLTWGIPVAKTSLTDFTRPRWWRDNSDIVSMFLLGLWAGRRRLLDEPRRHTRLLVSAAIIGLVVGVLGNNVDAFGASYENVAFLMPRIFDSSAFPYEVGNIGLTVFYLAGLALLYTRVCAAARILAPFGWGGWLALSNYLAQSILFNLVLPPRFATLPMLFGFFALQVVCSGLWLKWFRFGPVEWVWRSLTWWRPQPMRRSV